MLVTKIKTKLKNLIKKLFYLVAYIAYLPLILIVRWLSKLPLTKREWAYLLLVIDFIVIGFIFKPTASEMLTEILAVDYPVVYQDRIVEKEIEVKDKIKLEVVLDVAKKKDFTDTVQLKWLLGKLYGESRWGTSRLYYVNDNGTVDRGYCMLNDHWYKQISDECAWNLECCVGVMIDEYNKGNANNWLASDNL